MHTPALLHGRRLRLQGMLRRRFGLRMQRPVLLLLHWLGHRIQRLPGPRTDDDDHDRRCRYDHAGTGGKHHDGDVQQAVR